jgi:hypothetical protein
VRLLNREPWQIIVGFALLGLVMAAAAYAYAAFYNYDKPTNAFDIVMMFVSVILCPPQLLFVLCIDCEVTGWNGFTLYSIVGALNMALYAIIGKIVSYSRKPD